MTTDDRFAIALQHFERDLGRLHDSLTQSENEFLRDSVIQRFEFTFEAAWKAMYRWLRKRGLDVDEDAYSVIPEAFKRRIVTDAKIWGDMRRYRNLTSHTYNQSLAIEVAGFIRCEGATAFDALLNTLRQRSDE